MAANLMELARQQGLIQEQDSDDYKLESVELTSEEKEIAIHKALTAKRAQLNRQLYNERISRESRMPILTAEQLLKLILAKVQNEIPAFVLTPDQENIYTMLSQYFTKDIRFEERGYSQRKGILLSGSVGCGKTTIMRAFTRNPLASYIVKSVRQIASEYAQKEVGESALYRYSGAYYPLNMNNEFKCDVWGICFDDLGTEDIKRHFGNEANVMEQVLLNRYDQIASLPYRTHVTTNLDSESIGEFYGERVRSRMREMFNIIEVPGNDLRS
jgi:DNA replication protein DnaC